MLPSSIILTVPLGRSWADHGQIMGDRFMQKNPENMSFFRYRFFRQFMEICDFASRNKQNVNLFLQKMMRGRIVAQGFTIMALLTGIVVSVRNAHAEGT